MSTALQTQLNTIRTSSAPFLQSKLTPEEYVLLRDQFVDYNNPYPVPKVGTVAPSFSLTDQTGKTVVLSDLIASGRHIILSWYRGEWCPYCSAMLKAYNEKIDDFRALNADLYAITPTLPSLTPTTRSNLSLKFPILSDIGNTAAKSYGTLYQLSEDLSKITTKLGINWEKTYGDNTHVLPHPGVFIVEGKTGKLVFARVEPNITIRVDPAELIAELKKLQ